MIITKSLRLHIGFQFPKFHKRSDDMDEYISKHEAYTMMKDLEAAYIYPPVK